MSAFGNFIHGLLHPSSIFEVSPRDAPATKSVVAGPPAVPIATNPVWSVLPRRPRPQANVLAAPPGRVMPQANVTYAPPPIPYTPGLGILSAPPGIPYTTGNIMGAPPGMDAYPSIMGAPSGVKKVPIKGPPKIPEKDKPKPKPEAEPKLPNCDGNIVRVSIITALVDGQTTDLFHYGSTPMDDSTLVI